MDNRRFITQPPDPLRPGRKPGRPPMPGDSARAKFLAGTIISVSGWRRVFAADNNPESGEDSIKLPAALFAACVGYVFGAWQRGRETVFLPEIAVALDTRPTGPAIGCCVIRGLLAAECGVRFLGVSPTPEAMAYTAAENLVTGLIIVTASHNPVGHNGFKMSAGDGRVLDEQTNEILAAKLRALYGEGRGLDLLYARLRSVDNYRLGRTYYNTDSNKWRAIQVYGSHLLRMVSGERNLIRRKNSLIRLRQAFKDNPLGVVAELNGSARTLSIDLEFLEGLGLKVRALNTEPGHLAHEILPEGDSLLPACRMLELAHSRESAFEMGYVPDNDGDRGNVVVLGANGEARPLEAQEVFALAVAAELSFLAASGVICYGSDGKPSRRLAVVVNCCTSTRVVQIAKRFGARVFRAEVGEANILGLAEHLRKKGWLVRILGEGSNGGFITHPSRVRDPLSTVLAFARLLRLPEVLDQWRARCEGGLESGKPDLVGIARSLPRWFTTGQYEDRAVQSIATRDHDALKTCYEELFPEIWTGPGRGLAGRMGVSGWRYMNYEGMKEFPGPGGRSAGGRGGFKVILLGPRGEEIGSVWMRGSKTEPVFRVMADVSTTAADERDLLELHRRVLCAADACALSRSQAP